MDRHRHPSVRRTDGIATLDVIALLHHQDRRLPRVLPQGEHDLIRERHPAYRQAGGQLLELRRVHTVSESEFLEHGGLS
jgi:hypothetical protein